MPNGNCSAFRSLHMQESDSSSSEELSESGKTFYSSCRDREQKRAEFWWIDVIWNENNHDIHALFTFQVDRGCGMWLRKPSLCWFRERPAPSTPFSSYTWFCKQHHFSFLSCLHPLSSITEFPATLQIRENLLNYLIFQTGKTQEILKDDLS